ncbi:YceI family protein [Pullulanibacillus sp. KACC 23026]|uniref:YceI family protein n=1 Tax=Pullulanibacillus sp. KACC 23026 TaxID=3028315 RepID=UPI0023B12856|nr:YceI family protein [Pullulanibacillus sp. KACC 23026]WEG13726.1 YceI family protein [Pullulanibacillus sp. KACC 23026]
MTKQVWNVDLSHSSLEFTVKHMMVSKVRGNFDVYEAKLIADPQDLTTAEIEFKVDIDSINTRNADRDAHLKSADLFEKEKYPYMTFKATNIVKTGDNEYAVTGDLTLKGVTKSVTFDATFEGEGKNPWGQEVAGFTATGKINRSDFGISWNAALETGGVLVGDEVKIAVEIEATKAAE